MKKKTGSQNIPQITMRIVKSSQKIASCQMAFQVAADHPQVAGFGYLVANLATLIVALESDEPIM